MRSLLKSLAQAFGYRIARIPDRPPNFEAEFLPLYEKCKPYTMTSMERMHAVYLATKFVVANEIPGDLVECGVWRGGSCMMMASTLLSLGVKDRRIVLFDTFEGMTAPTDRDRDRIGTDAKAKWVETNEGRNWCAASLEDVKENLSSTGYPESRLEYVKGRVEDTLPNAPVDKIALLRLDTDWYESTRAELIHLYPRLVQHGVVLFDDYGHWEGSREAVDEYLAEKKIHLLLQRTDHAGRMAIKLSS
jgi:O-methyltransferase